MMQQQQCQQKQHLLLGCPKCGTVPWGYLWLWIFRMRMQPPGLRGNGQRRSSSKGGWTINGELEIAACYSYAAQSGKKSSNDTIGFQLACSSALKVSTALHNSCFTRHATVVLILNKCTHLTVPQQAAGGILLMTMPDCTMLTPRPTAGLVGLSP